jgi:putative spermidine/putrescine transport system permease protein
VGQESRRHCENLASLANGLADKGRPRDRFRHRLPAHRPAVDGWGLLAIPGALFLLGAFMLPIANMVWTSVSIPSPANYLHILQSPPDLKALSYTFFIAAVVTVVCVLIGYPWAYLMHHASRVQRFVLMGLVLVPFWSSLLVRTYAWTVLLRPSGVMNYLVVNWFHLDPLPLMGNTFGIVTGMSQLLLPFLVLPLFAVMGRIDRNLVPAAEGLGANSLTAFRRVFFPLSRPGLFAGALLVFVLSVGFYITPAILGSQRQPMISQAIVFQTNTVLDFGYASALGVILLVVTLGLVWLGDRLVGIRQVLGYEDLS